MIHCRAHKKLPKHHFSDSRNSVLPLLNYQQVSRFVIYIVNRLHWQIIAPEWVWYSINKHQHNENKCKNVPQVSMVSNKFS